jgi:hypothetical protein
MIAICRRSLVSLSIASTSKALSAPGSAILFVTSDGIETAILLK